MIIPEVVNNWRSVLQINILRKKMHKCEEGGAHLKCFFLFGFIDELEKQLFIKKTAEVGQ